MADERRKPLKCPNQIKGEYCDVCGGKYLCLDPWRKKRTYKERIKARREWRETRA